MKVHAHLEPVGWRWTMKIAIFVGRRFRRNVVTGFGFGSWDHEVHKDYRKNYGKRGGGLATLGG